MFVWGAGLLPYKDTFQTTGYRSLRRRNHLGTIMGHAGDGELCGVSEAAPLLHAMASLALGGKAIFMPSCVFD